MPFLRISGQGASGSDVDSEIETWFDLTQTGFEPVFRYTVQGSENRMGVGVSRRIRATAWSDFDTNAETIRLNLEVRYSSSYDTDLGFAEYEATYQRRANQSKFSLQKVTQSAPNEPAISSKDFEDLANIDFGDPPVPSNERLLAYTLPRLKQIASSKDEQDRGWLRSVLGFCKDTPERRTLLELLAKP
jgi:hypothetical protein